MKFSLQTALVTSLSTIGLAMLATVVEARPYPDQSGVCYFYRGDTQEMMEPCVISGGYGAGAHYAILRWSDGVDTRIVMGNLCEPDAYDEYGFCTYTVDDYEAEPYERNVFLDITTLDDPDNMTCYRVLETGNSVCYRFNS
jgi:hypothetical protein